MPEHPYGWLSLAPPVVAIVLAIVTRRVIVSLLAGVFAGSLIMASGNPIEAVSQSLQSHLWPTLINEDKLTVFVFTALMGSMVGIISRCGGMRGLVEVVATWANNRQRGQFVTWLLGLFIFFDDYANTVLIGNTMRPLTDRLKISREKLAYVVDSTAAPVAGLALVSTWVAGEIGFVQEGIDKLSVSGESWTAFNVFVHSIPYRFYVLWALVFVLLVAWFRRDFGPMLNAERRCLSGKANLDGHSETTAPATHPDEAAHGQWFDAVVPVVATVGSIVWLLYVTGRAEFSANETPSMMQVFGAADAYGSLLWGALFGVVMAAAMSWFRGLLTSAQILAASSAGALLVVPALAILWLASTLSVMTGNSPNNQDDGRQQTATAIADSLASHDISIGQIARSLEGKGFKDYEIATALAATSKSSEWNEVAAAHQYRFTHYRLYTGAYLRNTLDESLPSFLLPTLVFVLAAGIAFATGTSWGTMGIVMPLALPLAYGALATADVDVSATHPILLATVGSVLAGAIFGDHCSPISDTTVLSSQASGCDHVAHVWTQMPYALVVGAISIVCGTLPIGLGVPVWVLLPMGVIVMLACLLIFGKRAEDDVASEQRPLQK